MLLKARKYLILFSVIFIVSVWYSNCTGAQSGKQSKQSNAVLLNSSSCLNKNPLSIKLDSQFDRRTVWPQYVTGAGTILVALTTIIIVWISSRQTIQATKDYSNVQLETSKNQIEAQLNIAKSERIKELNINNRQHWINDLRDTVSKYIQLLYDMYHTQNRLNYNTVTLTSLKVGELRNTHHVSRAAKETLDTENTLIDIYSQLQLHAAKIELLLNPNPSPDENQLLINLKESLASDQPLSYIEPIKTTTKTILKTEWTRIQREISS